MLIQASLPPHLEHLSRRSQALRLPGPQAFTTSVPLRVLAAPHFAQSIFTLAPNLTRSAAVSKCFVDIAVG
jgi:hypothetical protein